MNVTEKCDIYSFGVVLLELLTGRRAIQHVDDGGDLVTWVKEAMQTHKSVSGIFDTRLDLSDVVVIEEMLLVLKVALFCTSSAPADRPTMREVVRMLMEASTRKYRDSTDGQSVENESCENAESVSDETVTEEPITEEPSAEGAVTRKTILVETISEPPPQREEEPVTPEEQEPTSEEPVSDKR